MSYKPTILLVDDTPTNLQALGDMLEQEGYEILVATNGGDALECLRLQPGVDLVLLDIMMPGMDGYQVCAQLKADPLLKKIPVIFISALGMSDQKIRAFHEGAEDYVTKPFQAEEVLARIKTHLSLKMHRDHLQLLVEQQTRNLVLAKEATIASMALLAEFRDPETGGHIQRCKNYVRCLAESIPAHSPDALSLEELELLCQSVPLHDIGKVGVPDAILHKPGPLSPEEWEEMKQHSLYGSSVIKRTEAILGSSSFLQYARELTEFHHEKWDGSGYPYGLRGRDIPLCARLMAIADVYDALISQRPYKEAYSCEQAFHIITEGDGRTRPEHFDPDLLAQFRGLGSEFARISREFPQ